MANITNPQELELLRMSGRISAAALEAAAALVRPGVTTQELNDEAERVIRQMGGQPAFLGYNGFPATLCTSINDEVVHGIPSSKRILQEGDIIGLDIGTNYKGLFSDTAITVPVGAISQAAQHLLDRTKAALDAALDVVKAGVRTGDIGAAVENFITPFSYGIVRQLTGHGLGHAVHEGPAIPNFGEAGTGTVLKAGSVIAIEPMVMLGDYEVETLADDWTVVTKDHSLAAHFEHTLIITPDGYELIT